MKVFVLFAVISCALGTRVYYPEENNINYKHFVPFVNKHGETEIIDILKEEVTVKATPSDVTFYSYNNKNIESAHVVTGSNGGELSNTHFDRTKETYFLIHGWKDGQSGDLGTSVKHALLGNRDVNVIVVDWSPIAAESYSTASGAVVDIGKIVGDFINNIIDTQNLDTNKITIVGHSLGAHVAGNAGAVIKSKVAQIIGLDPASPGFSLDNTDNRLDTGDAQYVQVLHTSIKLVGMASSIGHVDYFPNGGEKQEGCGLDILGTCAHQRAIFYLAEAIEGGRFRATKCDSYNNFSGNKCTSNPSALMGSTDVDRSIVGDYFLKTNGATPYAQG